MDDTALAACGHVTAPDSRFCSTCGAAVTLTAVNDIDDDIDNTRRRTPYSVGGTSTVSWSAAATLGAADPTRPPAGVRPVAPPFAAPPPAREYANHPSQNNGAPPAATSGVYPPGVVPPVLWLVIAALVGCAAYLLVPAVRLIVQLLPNLGGESFGRWFVLSILVVALDIAALGVGLLVIAVQLRNGDRVGQILAVVLSGVVAITQVVSGVHGTGSTLTLIGAALVVGCLTVSPSVSALFRARDDRPAPVSAAIAIVAVLGWLLIMNGVPLVPFHSAGNAGLYASLLIGGGLALLATVRPMKTGSSAASGLAIVGLGGLAMTLLAVSHTEPGIVALSALCVTCIVLLCGPASSRAYFNATSIQR
ncbi:MAG: hypothetical protein JWM93_3171 [Frankiales bacterium]|nr:hypothetical protein [Frankiales bacterium]